MIGLGTIINTAGVIAGGLIGLGLKNGIKKNMQDIMMQACGVATIFIGGAGTLSKMLIFQDGKLETQGTMLLIFSLVLGSLLGEWINIEQKMDLLGERIKKAVKAENDNLFVEGFVNVSLIICVGAMAIVGSVQDGISGDYSMLVAKAILDLIIVVVFAATYGIGAVFSAVPIFVYQGAITLAAAFLGSFVSEAMINDLSFIGSALIFCVGVNIGFGKKFRVGNMLPALIVPVLYEILRSLLR
ncbi:MAG: DUF554 domain-containing protein [Lachnospiraceae bacterium]|nr:DUF554 domain-containing protein [Lachnospiraceae bacterium]